MKKLISFIFITSCVSIPKYGCPTPILINSSNRSLSKLDMEVYKNAYIKCWNKDNENKCLKKLYIKPNYTYHAICGLKEKL